MQQLNIYKAGQKPCQEKKHYKNILLAILAKLASVARFTKPAGVTYQAICQQCGTTHNLTTYKRASGDVTLCNRHAWGNI